MSSTAAPHGGTAARTATAAPGAPALHVVPPASTGLAPVLGLTFFPKEFGTVLAFSVGPKSRGVIGYPAGGSQDLALRYDVAFTGTVDDLKPTLDNGCSRHSPPFEASRVEDVTASTGSAHRRMGDRTADYRKWLVTCSNDGSVQQHQAWVLPESKVAIYEQHAKPHNDAVVAGMYLCASAPDKCAS